MLGSMNARILALPAFALLLACSPSASPVAAPSPTAVPKAPPAPVVPAAREVDAAQAAALLNEHPDTVVLDVRTPAEHAEGHIAGAVLIDHDSDGFAEKLAALDKSRTYLVHCKSGRRSADARDILVRAGFPNVVHFAGGFDAWSEAGLPVVTGGQP